MVASSRIFAALTATLVVAASIAQVGCGVLHCVETVAASETRSVPPCHGGASHQQSGGEKSSHAPGGGDEECCRVLPLEPSSTTHGGVASPLHALGVAPPIAPLIVIPRLVAAVRPIDTGPPDLVDVSSPTPLRI